MISLGGVCSQPLLWNSRPQSTNKYKKIMKNILFSLLFALVLIPVASSAHTGETTTSQEPGSMMMQQVEDQALGDDLHEEMEGLMKKMLSGELSPGETDRMVELMDEHPGPGSMMMNRMMDMGTFGSGSGFNSHNNNSMMGYGLSGFGGGIVMILFWILVIVGIVVLVKYAISNTTRSDQGRSALDILKERYAKGEIEKDEFEAKKKDLQ